MFAVIVVGTDGSPNAEQAVRAAARIATDGGGTVHVVAVHPPPRADLESLMAQVPEAVRAEFDPSASAAAHMLAADRILTGAGTEFEGHMREGDPAEVILEVATATSADLVVVGSQGTSAGGRFRLGSVSTKVSQNADCAVLIIPAG